MKTEILEAPAGVAADSTARCNFARLEASAIHLENILVPLDFSAMASKSLQYAVFLAGQSGAKLTLLHVLKPPIVVSDFPYPGPWGLDGFDAIKKSILKIRSLLVPQDLQVDVVVRRSFVCDGILDVARETGADLIIVTTRGETGLKHMILGSRAESIVRLAPCPVLVVR